jgi:hypothetical protein
MAPLTAAVRLRRPRGSGCARDAASRRRCRHALARGEAAGEHDWVFDPAPPPPPLVELRLPDTVEHAAALDWRDRQTLPELRIVGVNPDGSERWRIAPERVDDATAAGWFAAPGDLPKLLPAHLESCLLVAAAEVVDAVVLDDGPDAPLALEAVRVTDVAEPPLRALALYAAASWRWDPAADRVRPTRDRLLVKLIGRHGVGTLSGAPTPATATRRGPYLASWPLGPALRVGVRDAAALVRRSLPSGRPTVLVTVPFLARGGAEHTLFETMRALAGRFDFAIVTLAPHRRELGDRRADFRTLTERIYCLGDSSTRRRCTGCWSRSSTRSAPSCSTTRLDDPVLRVRTALKSERPAVRIVDHLYDHQVGYIGATVRAARLGRRLCRGEPPHRRVLTSRRGWPASR